MKTIYKSKQQTVKVLNNLISEASKGIWKDAGWNGVYRVNEVLDESGLIEWGEDCGSKYIHDGDYVPVAKNWYYELKIKWQDVSGTIRWTKACLNITGSGCGTVSDPLGKYDVVAYIS